MRERLGVGIPGNDDLQDFPFVGETNSKELGSKGPDSLSKLSGLTVNEPFSVRIT